MTTLLRRALQWLMLAFVCTGLPAQAGTDLLPLPPLTGRVIDQTRTLSAAQAQALGDKLAALDHRLDAQIVVLIVPATAPEDIDSFTQRVGDAWKLGRTGAGRGLLIVVARNEHRARIAPAKSLEGAVPDLAAHRIIDEAMVPAFRRGDFAGGLHAAVDRIAQRLQQDAAPVNSPAMEATAPPADDGLARKDPSLSGMFALGFVSLAIGNLVTLFGRRWGALWLLLMLAVGGALMSFWPAFVATVVAGVLIATDVLHLRNARPARARGTRASTSDGPALWSWSSDDSASSSSGSSSDATPSIGGGDFGGGGASDSW